MRKMKVKRRKRKKKKRMMESDRDRRKRKGEIVLLAGFCIIPFVTRSVSLIQKTIRLKQREKGGKFDDDVDSKDRKIGEHHSSNLDPHHQHQDDV